MDSGEKFRSIVAAILDVAVEQVTDDLSQDAVDTWDSLNHINLIGALEQEFGLRLSMEKVTEARSVAEVKALLAEQGVVV